MISPYTVEIYKLAADKLRQVFLSSILKAEIDADEAVFERRVGDRIARQLPQTDDKDGRELARNLSEALELWDKRVQSRTLDEATRMAEAEKVVAHGDQNRPILLSVAGFHYYAGSRLSPFIDDRVNLDQADRKMYLDCREIARGISFILDFTIREYDRLVAVRQEELQNGIRVPDGKHDKSTAPLCDLCTKIYGLYIPRFRGVLPALNSSLKSMERYVAQQAQAT